MMEDLAKLQFSPMRDNIYAPFFKEVKYNGKILSDTERKNTIAIFDDIISKYSEGLPMMQKILNNEMVLPPDFFEIYRTVVSVMQFTYITMIDSMIACKYFILADKDYEKRFMRGKLMVILNEGFKRLYGFDEKTYKKSEWDRLLSLMGHFSESINLKFQDLTFLLEKHSKSCPWWREERNLETHLETEKLYISRQEEIIEGQVMIDTMKLFSTMLAVNFYLNNLQSCLNDYMKKHTKCVETIDNLPQSL